MPWSEITALAAMATAVAAFCAVGVAFCAFRSQEAAFRKSSDAFRLSISADLAARLVKKFDGDAFRRSRHSAAKALLDSQNLIDAENVFDFFETVGLFSRLGALNDEMIHSTFFHWINTYWVAGREYIAARRDEKATVLWVDFQAVYERAIALEKLKDGNSRDLTPPEEVIRSYLRQEIEECGSG